MSSFPTPDFGAVAEVYDEVRPADGAWHEVFELLVEEAELEGARVLDVGCGTGRLVAALSDRGAKTTGIDPSPEMLAVARRKRPESTFVEGRAEHLPFASGSFDRVVYALVVHLLDRAAAFAEAHRVLAGGGTIAVVTFDRSHFGGYYLQEYFPSIQTLDEQRFPDRATLVEELRGAGFGHTRIVPLHQDVGIDRASVLRRVRARHISTLQLVGEDEYAAGLERLEGELPENLRYQSHWLVAVSDR
jgi:ubiquinone/menaquinone biosynthesis C-methylase UbiE